MTGLYRESGLKIYESSHYSHGEHKVEVKQILTWYRQHNSRVLDIGCSGGLHALELAKRGFSVTGMDIEPSAIELAEKRNQNEKLKAKFFVLDIRKDDFSDLGKFDLVYSIGNVLSHLRKGSVPEIFSKIRGCLNENGIFLFDVLINAEHFQKEILPEESGLQIVWKRKLDEKTGGISMDGIFLESGFIQHFDVWGYKLEEMIGMLASSGFRNVDFSEKLDFIEKNKTRNPISLYFRGVKS